jgi:hypothetical protein
MSESESSKSILNLRNPSNIATAKFPHVIRVLVRPEDNITKKLIENVGTPSSDGKSFSVVVTREDGA